MRIADCSSFGCLDLVEVEFFKINCRVFVAVGAYLSELGERPFAGGVAAVDIVDVCVNNLRPTEQNGTCEGSGFNVRISCKAPPMYLFRRGDQRRMPHSPTSPGLQTGGNICEKVRPYGGLQFGVAGHLCINALAVGDKPTPYDWKLFQ